MAVQELLDHKIQPVRVLEVTELKGLLSGVKLYCFVHVLNNSLSARLENSWLVITQIILLMASKGDERNFVVSSLEISQHMSVLLL